MNKSLEEMTPDELRALADKREKENWVDPNKPIKEGFLKYDIYYGPDSYYLPHNVFGFFTKEEVDDIIDGFRGGFDIALERGTKFLCYNVDGDALWSDDVGYGVQEVDNDWAEKFLENIKELG